MPSVELANECGWAVLTRFKLLIETGLGASPELVPTSCETSRKLSNSSDLSFALCRRKMIMNVPLTSMV